MNKKDLIGAFSKNTGLSQKEISAIIDAFIITVKDGLKRKEKISITGLGTFLLLKRKGYTGRNPQTGAKIEVPDMIFPHFKPSSNLKESIR